MSKFIWRGLVVKDIRKIQRQGKTDLVFVDLVDPVTYESSGDFMYLPEDRNEMLPPKGAVVDVYTKPSMYAGKSSITFASVVPSASPSMAVGK